MANTLNKNIEYWLEQIAAALANQDGGGSDDGGADDGGSDSGDDTPSGGTGSLVVTGSIDSNTGVFTPGAEQPTFEEACDAVRAGNLVWLVYPIGNDGGVIRTIVNYFEDIEGDEVLSSDSAEGTVAWSAEVDDSED